jgi:hypothetical protein
MSKKTQKKRSRFMPPFQPNPYDKNTFNPTTMKAGMVNDMTFYGLSHWYKLLRLRLRSSVSHLRRRFAPSSVRSKTRI